jgi:enoyl-CoA hydratase/carnithine racemase
VAPDLVEALDALERQPLPVVGALNGPALGGGLELALACDIRIAVPDASLGMPAGRLGLVYSPGVSND